MEVIMGLIKVESHSTYQILNIEGDFVTENDANDLRESFRNIAKTDNNKVILNFKNLSYMSSTSLGVLLSANALLEKNNGKMIICNLSDYMLNIFQITKLNLILAISDNSDSAIQSL